VAGRRVPEGEERGPDEVEVGEDEESGEEPEASGEEGRELALWLMRKGGRRGGGYLAHDAGAGAAVDHREEGEGSAERGDEVPPLGDLIHEGVWGRGEGLQRGGQESEREGDAAAEEEALVQEGFVLEGR
jgi:hypothetical protein